MIHSNPNKNRDYIAKFAKFIFVFFLFFTFFGTQPPFQDRHTEIEEVGTSNIFNQFVYITIILGALIAIWPKRSELLRLIKREKFLTIFLFWCLITVIWSEFSFVSFKRLFQILAGFLASCSFLLYIENEGQIIKYFRPIVYLYLIINFFSVLLIPGAIDPSFGTFRGLTPHKNMLGQASLLCLILAYIFSYTETLLHRKVFAYFMMIMAFILLIGTQSTNSILSFLIMISIGAAIYFNSIFKKLRIGNLFVVLTILVFFGLAFSVYIIAPELFAIIPKIFGKDLTFSGRVELWQFIAAEIKQHLLFGTGFQGFWVPDNLKIQLLYDEFIWLPLQSHNGYIDLINELGLIGLILFLMVILNYFYNSVKLDINHHWKWLILTVLVLNFQETTLFRPGQTTSALFIFAYLICFANFSQPESISSES